MAVFSPPEKKILKRLYFNVNVLSAKRVTYLIPSGDRNRIDRWMWVINSMQKKSCAIAQG